jgi:hypoxanthine-DNA glycosylase
MTLNDAIAKVLEAKGKPMQATTILAEIIACDLYRQNAGGPPTIDQVRTRLRRDIQRFESVAKGLYQLSTYSQDVGRKPLPIPPPKQPAQYPNPVTSKQAKAPVAIEAKAVSPDHKQGLAPIVGPSPKVLILGTLPGDVSLRQQQYYANAGNRFWKLMQEVLGETAPTDYEEKVKWLYKHHIALWDVMYAAVRQGSLDSAIGQVQPNDLAAFLRNNPSITHIGLNGGKAQQAFTLYFAFLPELKDIKVVALYSTSGANQSISMKRLTVQWQELFNS